MYLLRSNFGEIALAGSEVLSLSTRAIPDYLDKEEFGTPIEIIYIFLGVLLFTQQSYGFFSTIFVRYT